MIRRLAYGASVLFVLLLASAITQRLQAQGGTLIVRGRVVERGDERAIPRATVTLGDASPVLTDDQGEFLIRGVRPGRYAFVVEALGYATVRTSVLVQKDEDATIRLDKQPLPLPPVDVRPSTVTLSGRVVEKSTGRSVPYVTVRIDQDEHTSTNEIGRFRLRGLQRGTYRLIVEGFGWSPLLREVDLRSDTSVVLEVNEDALMQAIIAQQVAKLASRVRSVGRTVRELGRDEFVKSNAASPVDIIRSRGGVQLNRCPRTTAIACIGDNSPVLYIDERRMYCGIEILAAYSNKSIQRVEVIGRGAMIRVYTIWFMETMNAGRATIVPLTFHERPSNEC